MHALSITFPWIQENESVASNILKTITPFISTLRVLDIIKVCESRGLIFGTLPLLNLTFPNLESLAFRAEAVLHNQQGRPRSQVTTEIRR